MYWHPHEMKGIGDARDGVLLVEVLTKLVIFQPES